MTLNEFAITNLKQVGRSLAKTKMDGFGELTKSSCRQDASDVVDGLISCNGLDQAQRDAAIECVVEAMMNSIHVCRAVGQHICRGMDGWNDNQVIAQRDRLHNNVEMMEHEIRDLKLRIKTHMDAIQDCDDELFQRRNKDE